MLEETNDSGTVQARYTTASPSYFAPLLHMWRSTSTSRFPSYDLTGSARQLLDASGTVTDSYELDAFGRMVSSTGSTTNPYKYDAAWGYISDPSGFQQLGARFYWPEIGRFLQQDPAGDGMNWYAYAGNSPVLFADPLGMYRGAGAFTKCMISENTGLPRDWVEGVGARLGIPRTPGSDPTGCQEEGSGGNNGPVDGARDPAGWGLRGPRFGAAGARAANSPLGRGLAGRALGGSGVHLGPRVGGVLRRINYRAVGKLAGKAFWPLTVALVAYSGYKCATE